MIQTVDNFYLSDIETLTTQKRRKDFLETNSYYCLSTNQVIKELNITLRDYQDNTFFSFFKNEEESVSKNEDNLIISIKKSKNDKKEDVYLAQTGNYIGKFIWHGLEIDIKSRFSDTFLKRMLNFANDVYLDDVSVFDAQDNAKNSLDYSKFIIYYMFIQKLEKAFLLGLPKSYVSINHHEMKVKGKIDINKFIKHDIPFKGKISSTSREQKETQEIIDVLYKALAIIEKESKNNNGVSIKNILNIKVHLKQHKSNKYVSNETINKALKSKALQNPIFSPYKKVLEYAKLIINANNLEEKTNADKETFGFLVDVSELFEIYLVKLLGLRLPDWDIQHDRDNKIPLYEEQFYHRHMYPDIVMRHKYSNKVMVFDAKYKRMNFTPGGGNGDYGDLDRSDFYQIHSYMSYYNNQDDATLIAGGLLYPISYEFDCRFNDDEKCNEEYKDKKAHSDSWFGNLYTKFIVDGVDLSYIERNVEEKKTEKEKSKIRMNNILNAESAFVRRIVALAGEN